MLALCAAIGSFHVKSPTTYFVMVTMTVRVLPFFLTVTLIRSGTFIVSTLGVRSYSDQRYSSMQISATRHSLGVSIGRTAGLRYSFPGSDVNRDASCPRFSGGGVGRGPGKAASTIATSVTETPSSPIAVACGAPMGSAPAVADVARLPSIGAPVFSMRGDPKPRSPAATQPARTTVPHNAANAASRRGLITSSLPISSDSSWRPLASGSLTARSLAVHAFGGEVLKFIGDGVLAIFPVTGVPAESCEAALRAIGAARAGMAHLDAARQAQGLRPLPFGAALHLGEILWGNIGAVDRLDFTAIGPAVNLVSRLEGLCRPLGRSVLISGAVAAEATAPLVPLGEHVLR